MILAALGFVATAAQASPCGGQGAFLYVEARKRVLTLCERGASKGTLPVALGQGGLGKTVEGDAKVPLGEYSVSLAVPSKDYHLFIPVGYPTPEQRRRGLTGSAIGVHGPPRGFDGPSSTATDWTLGCIAVGTDAEIRRVADWLRTSGARRIIIRAE